LAEAKCRAQPRVNPKREFPTERIRFISDLKFLFKIVFLDYSVVDFFDAVENFSNIKFHLDGLSIRRSLSSTCSPFSSRHGRIFFLFFDIRQLVGYFQILHYQFVHSRRCAQTICFFFFVKVIFFLRLEFSQMLYLSKNQFHFRLCISNYGHSNHIELESEKLCVRWLSCFVRCRFCSPIFPNEKIDPRLEWNIESQLQVEESCC
jgi:hypothetical protein